MSDLDILEDLEGYRQHFTDVALWTPYVREVCRRHGLSPCQQVRVGVPGTCPAFLVEDRWVVKFFGRLFEGGESYQVEREAARLVQSDPAIRVARAAASGELGGPGWPWPYLVFEFIQGRSIGEVWEQVSISDRLRAAREVGELARRLHNLPLEGQEVFPNTWHSYRAFLEAQRQTCVQNQRGWGTLPARLVDQIDAFLPPVETLVDAACAPHLIHADLTRDHLMGRLEEGRWNTLALIDFGDAMTGGLLYELVALHLDLFHGDRRLLAEFLDAYGLPPAGRAVLPRKALAVTLLHRFDVLSCLPAHMLEADSLDELAQSVWEVPA